MNISTLNTRQVLKDYQTLKAELVQKKQTATTTLGQFQIDDFFSRVDNNPTTKDTLIASQVSDGHITVVTYEEQAQQGDLQLKFKWVQTDGSQPGMPSKVRQVVIRAESGELISNEGNSSFNVVA